MLCHIVETETCFGIVPIGRLCANNTTTVTRPGKSMGLVNGRSSMSMADLFGDEPFIKLCVVSHIACVWHRTQGEGVQIPNVALHQTAVGPSFYR